MDLLSLFCIAFHSTQTTGNYLLFCFISSPAPSTPLFMGCSLQKSANPCQNYFDPNQLCHYSEMGFKLVCKLGDKTIYRMSKFIKCKVNCLIVFHIIMFKYTVLILVIFVNHDNWFVSEFH